MLSISHWLEKLSSMSYQSRWALSRGVGGQRVYCAAQSNMVFDRSVKSCSPGAGLWGAKKLSRY